MFKYQALIKDNLKEIAKLITLEQGKTIPDAEGDVMRGLQVCKICKICLSVPMHYSENLIYFFVFILNCFPRLLLVIWVFCF